MSIVHGCCLYQLFMDVINTKWWGGGGGGGWENQSFSYNTWNVTWNKIVLHEIMWRRLWMIHDETFPWKRKQLVAWYSQVRQKRTKNLKVEFFQKYLDDWHYISMINIIYFSSCIRKNSGAAALLCQFLKNCFFYPSRWGKKEAVQLDYVWLKEDYLIGYNLERYIHLFLRMIFVWQFGHIKSLQSVILAPVPFQIGPHEYPQCDLLLWQILCWFSSHSCQCNHGWSPGVWRFLAHNISLLDPGFVFFMLVV